LGGGAKTAAEGAEAGAAGAVEHVGELAGPGRLATAAETEAGKRFATKLDETLSEARMSPAEGWYAWVTRRAWEGGIDTIDHEAAIPALSSSKGGIQALSRAAKEELAHASDEELEALGLRHLTTMDEIAAWGRKQAQNINEKLPQLTKVQTIALMSTGLLAIAGTKSATDCYSDPECKKGWVDKYNDLIKKTQVDWKKWGGGESGRKTEKPRADPGDHVDAKKKPPPPVPKKHDDEPEPKHKHKHKKRDKRDGKEKDGGSFC